MLSYEAANNPDGNEIDSNPTDVAVTADGNVLYIDAGANSLFQLVDGSPELIVSWSENSVPDSLAITAEGDIYVGFLSPAPFIPGSAKVEHWSGGELVNTYEGLTMVVDVFVDADGNVYAVELAQGLGEQGFVPDSGRVVMLGMEGNTAIAEGLNFPYGMAQTPDGELVVAINSAFSVPGSGAIIVVGE